MKKLIICLILLCSGLAWGNECVKLPEPKPGDWRYEYKEKTQDTSDYKKDCINKKGERYKIVLQYNEPLSESSRKVLLSLDHFVRVFFQLSSVQVVLWPAPTRNPYYSWKPMQRVDGDSLLENSSKLMGDDVLAKIIIVDKDIYSVGFDYVFGLGDMTRRIAVISLYRLVDDDEGLFRARVYGTVAHEVGHILGLDHCKHCRCLMNGANSLDEGDDAPLKYCPVCLEKLRWNIGFNPEVRERELKDFYNRYNVKEN